MRVSTLLIADHAEAVNGKLYVTGGCWNQMFSPGFPVVHPHFSVAAAIQVEWTETNTRHSLELDLLDEDGQVVLPQPFNTQFEAGRPAGAHAGDDMIVVMVFNLNGLQFDKPGRYEFVLRINGKQEGIFAFRLNHQPQQPQPGQAPPPAS